MTECADIADIDVDGDAEFADVVAADAPLAARRANLRARLLMIVSALVVLGLVMVYSATSARGQRLGTEWAFGFNQFQWCVAGIAGLFIVARAPMRRLRALAPFLAFACLLSLVFVLIPGVGTKVNGAYRWFRLGSFSLQPSEVAKFGFILCMAWLLARVPGGKPRFFRHVLPMIGLIVLVVVLVMREPDLGTAALLGAVMGLMLVAGGAALPPLLVSGLAVAGPAAYYGYTHFAHLRERLSEWWLETGHHTHVSQLALGSGGLFGVGLGQGPSKLAYLPEAHTDFIFAMIGQELGLAGAGLTVALFAALVWTGLSLSTICATRFARLTAFGVTVLFGLQAAFNMGVVTGLLPPKGIQLPFVSYGGTGLCVNLALAGLLAAAARARPEADELARERALDAAVLHREPEIFQAPAPAAGMAPVDGRKAA